jgi:hypothetical protein
MAQIFNRAATSDNILILGTRESATQPFNAPSWTDLRVGFFLSLTQAAANDTPTGIAETFPASVPNNNASDWFYIGVKDSGPNMPSGTLPNSFIGFSNNMLLDTPNVQLVASDLALGTSAYYWRADNSYSPQTFFCEEANQFPAVILGGKAMAHFYQSADPGNSAPAGYYCGMLGFRMTRANPNVSTITVQIPTFGVGNQSADMFWTNAPTSTQLIAKLDPFPTTVQTLGPVNFGVLPDALFCYWPFHLSRLRISAWGILRVA